ncbi:MAG: DNA polymerase IV [Desulfobacterales bacterium]|jgi:DNA polymerase-4|nr:DNA polymerase IV [Desulfobacterales bacterium]
MDDRIILHIDMDAFFIAVEQRDDPSLRGKPAAVCGSLSRSVVTSATYEARPYGIRAGMPVQEAQRRCPNLILVEGDHSKYTETASRIFSTLKEYTPLVEVASIDEAYLDITKSQLLFMSPLHTAQSIKERIRKQEQLTCSIGVAPNKLLAKLGSRLRKPDGLVVIQKEEVSQVLKDLPVSSLFGIGPKLEESLKAMGIFTCGQLGGFPVPLLEKRFGVIGKRLQEMGLGLDDSSVIPFDEEEDPKSISHSVTLEEDTSELNVLRKVLLQLSERVSRRMRKDSFYGRRVTLTVRYSDFYTFTKQKTLSQWINSGPEIFQHSFDIFESILHPRPIRLLGVGVSQLKKEWCQLPLFVKREKVDNLLRAMDQVNGRFGDWTLTWGSLF